MVSAASEPDPDYREDGQCTEYWNLEDHSPNGALFKVVPSTLSREHLNLGHQYAAAKQRYQHQSIRQSATAAPSRGGYLEGSLPGGLLSHDVRG